jgi:hypothetical protein
VETDSFNVFEVEFVCCWVEGECWAEDDAFCVVGGEFGGEFYSCFGADLVEYVGGLEDLEAW